MRQESEDGEDLDCAISVCNYHFTASTTVLEKHLKILL